MRRKRQELTDEIVRCARGLVAAVRADWSPDDDIREMEARAALFAAVDALDAYGPAEIVGGPGAFVHGSPDTSEAAAHLASPMTGSVRRLIVDEIAVAMWGAQKGLTDSELEHRLRRAHTTTSSARNWCVNAGWLTDSGFRRETPAGREAVVWCLTPAAMTRRGTS